MSQTKTKIKVSPSKRQRHMTVTYPEDVTKEMILDILKENSKALEKTKHIDTKELVNVNNALPNDTFKSGFQLEIDCDKFNDLRLIEDEKSKNCDNEIRPVDVNPILIPKRGSLPGTPDNKLSISTFSLINNYNFNTKSFIHQPILYFLNEFLDEGVFDISRTGAAQLGSLAVIALYFQKNLRELQNAVCNSTVLTPIAEIIKIITKESPTHLAIGTIIVGFEEFLDAGSLSDTWLGIGCIATSLLVNKAKNKNLILPIKEKEQILMANKETKPSI